MLTSPTEILARDIDPMGGLGHISTLTPDAQARRRAALALRAQDETIGTLRADLTEARTLLCILVDRLGGTVEITGPDLPPEPRQPTVFRSPDVNAIILRSA